MCVCKYFFGKCIEFLDDEKLHCLAKRWTRLFFFLSHSLVITSPAVCSLKWMRTLHFDSLLTLGWKTQLATCIILKVDPHHLTFVSPETRLCHPWHGASQQRDWHAEEAVWGHLSGAKGSPARGRGGQVSTWLGFSGEGQDSGREGEHTVRSGFESLPLFSHWTQWNYHRGNFLTSYQKFSLDQ